MNTVFRTPLGKVSLTPRGAYDPATTYERLDTVQYYGSGYIALKDGLTGVTPADGNDWMLYASRGESGVYAIGEGIVGKKIDDTITEISVETPVEPITQAEYDALSEEEKQSNIMYAITDVDPVEITADEVQAMWDAIDVENNS